MNNEGDERQSLIFVAATASARQSQRTSTTGSARLCSKWHSSYIILLVSLLERVGKVGLAVNLVQYLKFHGFLGWSSASATIAALLCTKFTMLGAVITGLLADTLFGHFRVLLASLLLQFAGSLLLLTATLDEFEVKSDDEHRELFQGLVTSGLVMFGLGLAGSAGTEIPLGVSQHDLKKEGEQKAKVFFPRYYWCINVGSFFGTLCGVLQVQVRYHLYGYILPPVFYLLSIAVLLAMNKAILTEKPSRANPFSDIWSVAKEAIRVRWIQDKVETAKLIRENQKPNRKYWKDSGGSLANWVRHAEETCGGGMKYNTVAKAHNFLSVVAVLSIMVFCQITLTQTLTSFVSQGNLMTLPIPRVSMNRTSFYIPASFFNVFNNIGILLGIPLVIYVIYPRWQSFSQGAPPSHLKRITAGMVIAILAIVAATVLEVMRRQNGRWNSVTVADHTDPSITLTVSSLSIFYQIPQYSLSGISEVFIIVSALEFAYSRAPTRMKGIAVGLVYASTGLSSVVSVGTLLLIQKFDDTIFYRSNQQGEVHYFFLTLACIMVLGLVMFHIIGRHVKPVPIFSEPFESSARHQTSYGSAINSYSA
ncbi:solute carrier family 15 member 4-like [Sycon ciliatum]|uniref:solute carrier family 15 member 4-like n=1 Tax=Sycon ciliatum TaxID=27933 RepID=UPI0031F62AC9